MASPSQRDSCGCLFGITDLLQVGLRNILSSIGWELDSGGDVNVSYKKIMAILHIGVRPILAVVIAVTLLTNSGLAQVSEIHRAVDAGDIAKVKQLLLANPALVNLQSSGGSTPLHIAAGKDNAGLVKLLIEFKADVNARTKKGLTPLHVAAYVNAANAAEALVAAGADVNARAGDNSMPIDLAMKRNADAVVKVLTVQTKAVYTDKSIDPRFADAEKARASGQLQKAYDIYSKLVREQPENEKINFAYGMVCMSLNEYGRAQLAFERIVQEINPNNDRARIELANAYLASRQYDQARRQYEDVLARNPQAPDQLRQNIERGLQLAKQGAKKWYFSGRVNGGYFHDSNVNVGPNSREISIEPIVFGSETFNTLTVDQGTLPMKSDGGFAAVALSGAYDFGAPGNWMLTGDGAFYQNWLKRAASSNESAFYQAVVGLRDSEEQSMVKYPLQFAHVARGGDSLLDMYGFVPSYQFVAGKGMDYLLATDAAIELRDWSAMNDRDGYYAALGERFQHVIGQQKHSIGAGIGAFYDHTKAGEYQNIGGAVSMDGYLRLPWSITLYARARYTHAEYAKKEELAPEKRKDDETDLVGGLNVLMTKWWGMDLSYAKTINRSTFDLYQYDRDVATLSTFFTF